jgi:hypothetical protein
MFLREQIRRKDGKNSAIASGVMRGLDAVSTRHSQAGAAFGQKVRNSVYSMPDSHSRH